MAIRRAGYNYTGTAGPLVRTSVNGGQTTVFLGNGGAYLKQVDFALPLNGINWRHRRVFSSKGAAPPTSWQGEGWWGKEMMNISVLGADGSSDVDVQINPHTTLTFTYAAGSWTCQDNFLYTLTFTSGSDEYTLSNPTGSKLVFHDSQVTNTANKLKRIENAYGNDMAFIYSGADLDYIDVDVVEGSDHRITYDYFTIGDNTGLLQYIKLYKTTTTTGANLIGKVEYVYHDSTSDAYGIEDDLMKVIVSRKATTDGDGVLSIQEEYFYRYYKGTYDAVTNPGTDHQLRYVLNPENADRLNIAKGDPLTQTNADFEDYANIIYEYDSNGRARQTQERLTGVSCGCGGAGGSPATTDYTWSINSGNPDLDTWKIHGIADRADNSRVIFDMNRWYDVLTWVVQDDKTTPTRELIWHFDYGTSGASENRRTAIHYPSACSDYSETSPYGVTLRTSDGLIYVIDYDFVTDTYDGYPEKIRIKKGTSGTEETLIAYARTISERPDLVTTTTEYESTGEADGRSTTTAYTFYDDPGDKVQIKQITTTPPTISTAKNGPGTSYSTLSFFDKRTGAVRWTKDGEGYVKFYAYDIETGVADLSVVDANTSTLMTVIDNNWDGITHGGLADDDTVPFSRSGSGTALDIDNAATVDWLGRARKQVDAEGMITYTVYKDDETRVYPAWNTSTFKTLLPIRITKTDKEGRPEDAVTLNTDVTPTKDAGNEPTGAETYANSDMASRAVNTYNISGMLQSTDRYHSFPASGDGTRYTHFYRTDYEYDSMGRREFVIADVSDESTYDREQVTKFTYDFVGRRIKVEEGVSDNTHDISTGKPTLNTTVENFYDDPDSDSTPEQGDGDGNLNWVRRHFGTGGGEYDDTEYRYDWRNRRSLIIPPTAPFTLVKHDHLNRITASGTYSATTNLDPGDDPATTENTNRLDLSKNFFDEQGRVYKTIGYDDPADATPADKLKNNTYRDRRGMIVASDPANTGVTETKFDGAGRRTEVRRATVLETTKYVSGAFDYLDDDENIVQVTEYTLDDVGRVQKTITKELNHNDTDGIDLTNNDDYIRTYVYNWYDDAHRRSDTANYGTNDSNNKWKDNSTAPTYGSSAPARSDEILVTTYTFDNEGRREKVTDPKNIVTKTQFDKLGRTIAKTEDEGGGNLNRKTEYEYNGQGSLSRIIADTGADNTYANGAWTMVGSDTDQVTEYAYTDGQNANRVKEIRYPTGDGTVGSTQADKIVFSYNVDGTLKDRTDQNGTVITWSYDTLRRKTEEEVTTLGTYTGGAGSVDGAVRAFTWTYDSEGLVERVTSHTDTTPDTTNWTDAANQIKNTYNAADKRTKEEQEVDGAVDGSTLSVDYGFGTNYRQGNRNRKDYITYPDGRKIWFGYTHSGGAGTFQDTINDKFNRAGQIAKDNSGAIGDLYAEYDFNGSGRMVRRNHDEASGAYGNDTRMDLWHETSGEYAGLDRFGRIVDMKHTEFSGTAVDFARRKYGHDRNGNRTSIEHVVYKAESEEFTYDNLNRLTKEERGILDANQAVESSKVEEALNMDILGNFTSSAGGLKFNQTFDANVTHAINATNEITTLDTPNTPNAPAVISDLFTTSLSSFWSANKGTWSISSNKLHVDTLDGTDNEAVMLADADLDVVTYDVKVKFPTGSGSSKAGIVFLHDGNDSYHAVLFDRNANQLSLFKVTNGSMSKLANISYTIPENIETRMMVTRLQRRVEVYVGSSSFSYNFSSDPGTGSAGLYADKTNVTFDNFKVYLITEPDPYTRGTYGIDAEALPGGGNISGMDPGATPTVGGEVVFTSFHDDDYMVQVDIDQNSGTHGDIWVRRTDRNNAYRIRVQDTQVDLEKIEDGSYSSMATGTYTLDDTVSVNVKLAGTSIKVWVNGTLEINTTDSTHAAGGVALAGAWVILNNLKIGYDNNADDDLDDVGDDVVIDEVFTGTSFTVTHDDAGNLIDDGRYQYIYDSWNRLVKIRTKEDAITIQTAEFDALGRRMKKVVSNSGQHDKTEVYLYDGQKIIETRDGSNNMVQQFIHGTRYIDELVMVRVKSKGELYIHQDANWNVIATTDMGGHVVERNVLSPYGELTVDQVTGYGDYDGDNDVDVSDRPVPAGSSCATTFAGACRIIDLDFDGDYDATDETNHENNLPQGWMRHPGLFATATQQPFAHQGLLFEPEVGQYQNRARQYDPGKRRFVQRDPLAFVDVRLKSDALYQDGMNLYSYTQLNPLLYSDPQGLKFCACWGVDTSAATVTITRTDPVGCLFVPTQSIIDGVKDKVASSSSSCCGCNNCPGTPTTFCWTGAPTVMLNQQAIGPCQFDMILTLKICTWAYSGTCPE